MSRLAHRAWISSSPAPRQRTRLSVGRRRLDHDGGRFLHRDHGERRRRPELLRRGEHVRLGRTSRQSPLDGGLLGIAGGEPGGRMHTGHAHEEGVGRDLRDRLDGDRPARHDRVLEQAATDHEDLDRRVRHELAGDRRAVGDHGPGEVVGEMAGELLGGRPAVDDDRLSGSHECRSRLADRHLAFGRDLPAHREVGDRGRRRQCPAVDSLQLALGGELAEVTPDRVVRQVELLGELLGDQLTVAPQHVEDQGPALGGQHRRPPPAASVHETS